MVESGSQPREERRVVTVVFTDLVGFTERSESLDPEDVRLLLTTYYTHVRSIFEEHGGTVDKFIGDAVLAVFGAPVAHEDDAERAVRAALAICEWASGRDDLELRAGVNTGTALVVLDPTDTGIGIVAGDMVNTASRIQSAAPVGRVLVGDETYRATAPAFEFVEREPVEAKGKSAPLCVWEPVEARAGVGEHVRGTADAPLVGRAKELDRLVRAFERAVETGGVEVVTLVGVPGIGKTRLVTELEDLVRETRPEALWLEGRALPYGGGSSFRALADMVRTHVGAQEGERPEDASQKLGHAIAALTTDESDQRWLAAHLRPLIGIAGESEGRDDTRADAFAAWRRFLELLAARRPLALVFEDLHWADDAMLEFLDEFTEARAPVLVLGTARPELLERRPGLAESEGTVRLEPLSSQETGELLRALAKRFDVGVDVESTLVSRTAGNPLYAAEFVRMLAEGDRDLMENLPHSVQGIVAARLDAVSPDERAVLQDACVIGATFWPAALRHLANGDADRLGELLASLERKEFVLTDEQATFAGEPEVVFRHPLIREVAYEQLPRARRAEKHRRAAEWAESLPVDRADSRAELLADHYVRALEYTKAAGGEVGDLRARAARALRESGDRARAVHSLDVAASRYAHALELSEHEEERAGIGLALAETQLRTGSIDEANMQLERVVAIARKRGLATILARAALARGGVGVRVFDPEEALVALLEEALVALGDEHQALRARVLARLATELYYEDPPTLREELSEEAVRLAREGQEPEALLDALNARRVTLWSPDRLDERLDVSRELIALAESAGDRERSLVARTWLVTDLVEGGDLDAARTEIDAYARLVEPLGIPAYSWWVPAWRAMLAGVEGRFDDLRVLAGEAEEIGTRAGDGNAVIYRNLACWIADMQQGRDQDRWLQYIEEGVGRDGPSGAFRCALAMQHALAGRHEDARKALAALGPTGFGAVVKDMNFFAGASEFTVAVGALGDAAAARQAYEALRPYAGRMFLIARAAVFWGPADSFLGRLAATAGLFDEAEEHFEAALEECERVGARVMASRTRWWYASMLHARDEPGDAERATELAATAEREAEELGLALERVSG